MKPPSLPKIEPNGRSHGILRILRDGHPLAVDDLRMALGIADSPGARRKHRYRCNALIANRLVFWTRQTDTLHIIHQGRYVLHQLEAGRVVELEHHPKHQRVDA